MEEKKIRFEQKSGKIDLKTGTKGTPVKASHNIKEDAVDERKGENE